MQKKTKTVIRICVLIVALAIGSVCFWGSWHRDRIDRDEYLLDFSYMDENDSQTMYLESGDILKVTYEVKDGRINVTIGISEQDPIYRGSDVQTEDFELPIQEAGEYVISVNASKASGRLEFERKGYEE